MCRWLSSQGNASDSGTSVRAGPVEDGGARAWDGDCITLGTVAAHLRDRSQRFGRLDALGDHVEAQVVREVDRRAHDRCVALARGHVANERAIDLEAVERQLLQ